MRETRLLSVQHLGFRSRSSPIEQGEQSAVGVLARKGSSYEALQQIHFDALSDRIICGRGMVTTECSARAKRSLAVLVGNVCDSRCRHKRTTDQRTQRNTGRLGSI